MEDESEDDVDTDRCKVVHGGVEEAEVAVEDENEDDVDVDPPSSSRCDGERHSQRKHQPVHGDLLLPLRAMMQNLPHSGQC